MKIGFDSEKYLNLQYEQIMQRINTFSGKLYMEFGGKLFDDLHASRVLPGFEPNIKIQLLKKLRSDAEIIIVISAVSIEKNKIRADFNITYGEEVLRLIDNLRHEGLTVSAVVITMYNGQNSAKLFANKLERRNEKVYYHNFTKGYPNDVNSIVSEEGYGANPFIKTTKKLVVVTAPGPNSGKLGTCLSQLYHEYKNGNKAGYAKYETFPIWNLPLKHPVNVAYEAATADLEDINMVDSFHFNAYKEIAISYNRDLSSFPVLKNILAKITEGKSPYLSPTDMGVNMAKSGIVDNEVCQISAKQEIIRRYYHALCDYKKGLQDKKAINRIEILMQELEIDTNIRNVVNSAKQKRAETGSPAFALELESGEIICGRTKTLIGGATACILNCLKALANIEDTYEVIPKCLLEPMLDLNKNILGKRFEVLSLKDILTALSVSATTNNKAKKALEQLSKLKGTEAHSTYILSPADEETIKSLGINLTSEPVFANNNLFF